MDIEFSFRNKSMANHVVGRLNFCCW